MSTKIAASAAPHVTVPSWHRFFAAPPLARRKVEDLLILADIGIHGDRPWDLRVHREEFFGRVLREGSLGLGESYMDGWWDCEALDEFFARLLSLRIGENFWNWRIFFQVLQQKILNLQSRSRAFLIGERHYDIGNDLYESMLGRTMAYSCGYWRNAKTLHEAQDQKHDVICRKIGLKRGQRVLDIGCGWGSFGIFAAKHYGARVTGITVSKEQVAYAREHARRLPVEFRFQDYRDVEGQFDHIISIGMFEHVGTKNYRTYMRVAKRHLKDDGLFLLHTIGRNTPAAVLDPWIARYIFPGGMLPALSEIFSASEDLFVTEDVHNFGQDYDKTLMTWYRNFQEGWLDLRQTYDNRFYRMWTYYLLSCAGLFRTRGAQVWQIVFSKDGVRGGYNPAR